MSSQEDTGTEAEGAVRRRLRKQQRNLHDEILDNKERLGSAEDDLYTELRLRNNEMFQSARHCREQHLDAENLKVIQKLPCSVFKYAYYIYYVQELANVAKIQATKMNSTTSVFNYSNFAEALREAVYDRETKEFSWARLGRECG